MKRFPTSLINRELQTKPQWGITHMYRKAVLQRKQLRAGEEKLLVETEVGAAMLENSMKIL